MRIKLLNPLPKTFRGIIGSNRKVFVQAVVMDGNPEAVFAGIGTEASPLANLRLNQVPDTNVYAEWLPLESVSFYLRVEARGEQTVRDDSGRFTDP